MIKEVALGRHLLSRELIATESVDKTINVTTVAQSMVLSTVGQLSPPASSLVVANAATRPLSLSSTPNIATNFTLHQSPNWLQDEMRHKSIMTPPLHVSPTQMQTPDAEKIYMHVSTCE